MHFWELISPRLKLNRKNQSSSKSSFFSVQHYGCWNFNTISFHQIRVVKRCPELEVDRDSPYLAHAEPDQEDSIQPELKIEWEKLPSTDSNDKVFADPVGNFYLRKVLSHTHKKNVQEAYLFSKESSDVQKCYVYVARGTAVMMLPETSFDSATKVSTKCTRRER